MMILRWKSVYEMVFENRVSKAFLRAIPGLDDYALLGKAWYHTTEDRRGTPVWDTVVFDIADTISVLHFGEVLETGAPEQIKNSQKVQEIYLGTG